MEKPLIYSHLPVELWSFIMSRLSTSDLLSLSVTCKLFNCLANDTLRNVRLPIHRHKVYTLGLVTLVRQARFVRVGLDLSERNERLDEAWAGIFSRDCLRRFLNSNQQKLFFESNEEIREFFFPLNNLRLKANLGERSFNYLDSLFSFLAMNPCTLKALDLEGGNLSKCEPNDMALGVNNVLIANLERVWLSPTHFNKIFMTLGQGTSFLQFLSLAEEDLSEVDEKMLALGVVNLSEVDLSDTKLSETQLESLFETIASAATLSLTSIRLSSVTSLARVSPSLLSRSVSRLVRVDLQWTDLSSSQLVHLATNIVHSASSITSLSLAGVELSTLPTSLFNNMLTRLTTVDLTCTDLTAKQSSSMLTSIATGNARVHSMAMDCSCLEEVQDEVVVGVCNTLSRVVFHGGGWSSEGGKSGVVYSALMDSTSMLDCSVMCCGIATATLVGKYPSADTFLSHKTRGYFLNR